MIPIKVISTQDADLLQVRFFPTDICNFNCSYCFPGSHDNKYRYPKDTALVVTNFRKLFDLYSTKLNKTRFHLVIAGGGEPTMWPGLEQFCKEIKESHNVYITIVSNGSRSTRWWVDNSAYFDDVVLSYHHAEADVDHHCEVADLMFARGLKVTSLVLMDAKHWDKCINAVNTMRYSVHPWYIQTKEIVDAPGSDIDSYTAEQLAYVNDSMKRLPDSSWLLKRIDELKTHESIVLFDNDTAIAARPHSIITNGWNKFKGWKCNVGLQAIAIDASGEVLASCQLAVFDKLNVFNKDFNTSAAPAPIICSLDACSCQPDTHVTKSL